MTAVRTLNFAIILVRINFEQMCKDKTIFIHYPALSFPTDAHNVKKCRVIKTF